MKYKHVIWDWNGTLLDDRWLCVEGINQGLLKRGLPIISEKTYRKVFTFPVEDYYKKLGFKKNDFINSENYANSVISIPIFPGLKKKYLKFIVSKINNFFN